MKKYLILVFSISFSLPFYSHGLDPVCTKIPKGTISTVTKSFEYLKCYMEREKFLNGDGDVIATGAVESCKLAKKSFPALQKKAIGDIEFFDNFSKKDDEYKNNSGCKSMTELDIDLRGINTLIADFTNFHIDWQKMACAQQNTIFEKIVKPTQVNVNRELRAEMTKVCGTSIKDDFKRRFDGIALQASNLTNEKLNELKKFGISCSFGQWRKRKAAAKRLKGYLDGLKAHAVVLNDGYFERTCGPLVNGSKNTYQRIVNTLNPGAAFGWSVDQNALPAENPSNSTPDINR